MTVVDWKRGVGVAAVIFLTLSLRRPYLYVATTFTIRRSVRSARRQPIEQQVQRL
jgi:hypothetical protein